MCGLVGFLKFKTSQHTHAMKQAFKEILYFDAVRGWDATGVALVGVDNNFVIYKKAIDATTFINTKQFDQTLQEFYNAKYILGHNRWATTAIGNKHDAHAHPFNHGDIILIHNGHVSNTWEFDDKNNFSVDSEAVCYGLSKQTPEELIPRLVGDYALVWVNLKLGTINFITNGNRPLILGNLEGGEGIVFGSELYMMLSGCARNNLKITGLTKLQENIWVEINPEDEIFNTKLLAPRPKVFQVGKVWENELQKVSQKAGTNGIFPYARHETTVPPSKISLKRTEKIKTQLASLNPNFSIGKSIAAMFTDFKHYELIDKNNIQRGALFGLTHDEKYHRILVPNIELTKVKPLLDVKSDVCYFSGTIRSFTFYPYTHKNNEGKDVTKAEATIILDEKTYVTISESAASKINENLIQIQLITENDDLKYFGPKSKLVSRERFEELVKDGCTFCQEVLFLSDHEEIAWTKVAAPICSKCQQVISFKSDIDTAPYKSASIWKT